MVDAAGEEERDAIDAPGDDPTNWALATGEPVPDDVVADLVFAWRACRSVKSNAILLAHDRATVGVGMGQVNRVDSCHLAVSRAGDRASGSVAASDAFFPFADGAQLATATSSSTGGWRLTFAAEPDTRVATPVFDGAHWDETEDAGNTSGFYRYSPHTRNQPAGDLHAQLLLGAAHGTRLGPRC